MNADEVCLSVLEALPHSGPYAASGEDVPDPAASGWLLLCLECFDLEAFLDSYAEAQKQWCAEPPLVIDRQAGPLATLDAGPDEWADELLDRGRVLFFPAHERAVDDPRCVIGCRHDGDALGLGLLEGYGYLVEVEAGVVSVQPALYDAGASVACPREPCGSLAACLATFLEHFVRVG
jgi:hypothetical protein